MDLYLTNRVCDESLETEMFQIKAVEKQDENESKKNTTGSETPRSPLKQRNQKRPPLQKPQKRILLKTKHGKVRKRKLLEERSWRIL
jgi:hypothetical protein